ncbi:MAG: pyrroline-5-carboxylate reductase [Chloroflexota bacterium]|nr:pyrroline-5-carboxylate reductase [Chloroflexota bacterium]
MSPLSNTSVSFIGAGAMAEAMIAGVLKGGLMQPGQVWASHPREARREDLQSRYGINTCASNAEAASQSDLLVLTVKPQVLRGLLLELRGHVKPEQVALSVVAGASSNAVATGLLHSAVARAMPNTPAQIGQGMTVWTATPQVEPHRRSQVQAILGSLGRELWVDDEKMLDMATALSGTGPTYVLLVMEALIDAGVHMGFSRRVAQELVQQTMLGSVLFAQETNKHPAELRNMVTSPGGTSAEAIYQMEKGGLRTVLSRAVYAAYERTQALSEAADKSVLSGQ